MESSDFTRRRMGSFVVLGASFVGSTRTEKCGRFKLVAKYVGRARSGMVAEKVAPRPERLVRTGRGLRAQSQPRTQPQQGRPCLRSGVLSFTSRRARVTPDLAPRDRAQDSGKGDGPQLKADVTATRNTSPNRSQPAPIREPAGRLQGSGCARFSDVRTR